MKRQLHFFRHANFLLPTSTQFEAIENARLVLTKMQPDKINTKDGCGTEYRCLVEAKETYGGNAFDDCSQPKQ